MFETLGLLVVSFTVLVNLFLLIIVIRSNSRSASNILLSLLAFLIILWTISNYIALSPGDEKTRLLWVRIVMLVTTPFGPLIFLLASIFPKERFVVKQWLLVFIIIINVITAVLAISPLMFTNLQNLPGSSFSLTPGWAILFYAFNLIGFLTWGFVRLLRKYKRSVGVQKKQLRLFVFGIIISFTLMTLTNFIAVVIFKSIKLTFLGPTFTLIIVASLSYAIVRHRLLNIKVIAAQLLTTILLIVLFSKLLVFVSFAEWLVDLTIFVTVLVFGILLVRSIALEVKQRERLQELTAKLKGIDKQKDEFISVAAHELRSPLTAIKGYISMVVEGDGGKIEDKARSYLSDANAVNDRLIRLVNNMLNVSRIEEGRLVYQMEIVNLIKAIQEIYYSFKFEAERKKLEFKLDVSHGVKDKIQVDPDRVREIIGNYVSNAIKFTDEGSVDIKITNPTSKVIRVEVIDTGPGITKEEQQKLFRKFSRASSTEGKTIGTGLGLYISKLLTEEFHGKVGLESEFGKGSNFWFELPLAKK